MQGVVLGAESVQIVGRDRLGRGGRRRLLVTSPFALISLPTAEVDVGKRVQLHFLKGGEKVVLDDHGVKADLEKRGQLVPVYVDTDGNVLDGHHRLELLENPKVKLLKGLGSMEERRAFVLANNMRRRNLSPDQKEHVRKAMKATAKNLREEDPKRWTQEKLAVTFGVARSTVELWESDWVLQSDSSVNVQREPEKPDARVKLTADGKAKAIERVKAGESITQVAADLGVNKSTVSRIFAKDERQEATRQKRKAAVEASPVRPTVAVTSWKDWLPNQDDCDLLLTDPPYMTDVADIGAFAQWLPVALAKVNLPWCSRAKSLTAGTGPLPARGRARS